MRFAAALGTLLLASACAQASMLVEASAGPDFVASGHQSVSFDLTGQSLVRLGLGPLSIQPVNEDFACAAYPDVTARCEGVFGGSLVLLRVGDSNPVLFRGFGTNYTHGL